VAELKRVKLRWVLSEIKDDGTRGEELARGVVETNSDLTWVDMEAKVREGCYPFVRPQESHAQHLEWGWMRDEDRR
jgi:hypothetical protein